MNRSCWPISRYDAQSHPANSSSRSAAVFESDSVAVPIARVLLDPLNARVLQWLGQGKLDDDGIMRDATEASEAHPAHDGYAAPGRPGALRAAGLATAQRTARGGDLPPSLYRWTGPQAC